MLKRLNKNKKGLSTVIATLIIITLVMVTASIVWVEVSKILKESQENTQACFNIFDKVTLNREYSCYNSTSKDMELSINIGDIDVEEVLILISGRGESESAKITSQGSQINYVRNYNNLLNNIIKLPGKNEGKTYLFNTTGLGIGIPQSVSIAPKINKKQCEVSDIMRTIDNCMALA